MQFRVRPLVSLQPIDLMFAHFSLAHWTIIQVAVAGLTFLLGYLLGRSQWWSEWTARLLPGTDESGRTNERI